MIISERFHPEEFLVNDLAAECKARGDDVEILTQVPSYPFDKIFDGYRNRTFQTTHDFRDGIPVHRVSTIFGYNRSVARKVLNYLHFGFLTSLWALWNGRRFDKVFVCHTAALTMAAAVFPLKLLWRKHITIWTQDLWPDAVYAYGFKPSWWKAALLNTFVRATYGCCRRITVSCPAYVGRVKELTGRDAEFIPQWDPSPAFDIADKPADGKCVFTFAGNLGVPQNLENVIRGFAMASITGSELHIVGGGVMLEKLKQIADEVGGDGKPAIVFYGRQPRASMPERFAESDCLVISLTAEYRLTFPAKFQSYIKAGRPLLGIIYGDVADMIEKHGLGVSARPDDIPAIAAAFRKVAELVASGESAKCGDRARQLSAGTFDRARLITRLMAE